MNNVTSFNSESGSSSRSIFSRNCFVEIPPSFYSSPPPPPPRPSFDDSKEIEKYHLVLYEAQHELSNDRDLRLCDSVSSVAFSSNLFFNFFKSLQGLKPKTKISNRRQDLSIASSGSCNLRTIEDSSPLERQVERSRRERE